MTETRGDKSPRARPRPSPPSASPLDKQRRGVAAETLLGSALRRAVADEQDALFFGHESIDLRREGRELLAS